MKADDDVWKTLIQEVDENSDGEINFEEFKEMMTKIAWNQMKITNFVFLLIFKKEKSKI